MTIKYGKGYEETWAVFRGEPAEVRADIITYFDLDPEAETTTSLNLNELVINVTKLAHNTANAVTVLGGKVTKGSQSKPADQPKTDEAQQPSGSDDPWAQAGSAPADAPPAEPTILEQIEACADRTALKLLWSENQAAFEDADVMAAWKAKGKSLPAAA